MDILFIFSKIKIADIKTPKSFILGIKDKSKMLLSSISDDFDVKMIDGYLPNSLENTKVCILLNSEELKCNSGRLLIELKKSFLEVFEAQDLELGLDEFEIKVETKFDYSKIADKSFEKKEPSKENNEQDDSDEFDFKKKSTQYIPIEPNYSFDRVIISNDTKEKIEESIGILECEQKVFEEWGLSEIQPHPSTALSFFGPSGTGKTMAAEAVASKLGKKILKVSYADVESKYHGEGPKMVKAIFYAAEKENAVLFFDEADSLLSKRLTHVTQGSEQAINSMRSQLLICLEDFKGIVIFATNLVVNYDQAFLTRLISVEFKNPEKEQREKIWSVHLEPLDDGKPHKLHIPLAEDVDIPYLADRYEMVGREIRNVVVSTCVAVALEKRNMVTQSDFIKSCDKLEEEKKALKEARGNPAIKEAIAKVIKNKVKEKKESEIEEKEEE